MEPSENAAKSEEFLKEGIEFFKQMRLENTARMTSGLSARIEKTNERIGSLEKSIISADQSSSRLATSLNRLTLALVVIAFLALAWDIFKWSREPNKRPEANAGITPVSTSAPGPGVAHP